MLLPWSQYSISVTRNPESLQCSAAVISTMMLPGNSSISLWFVTYQTEDSVVERNRWVTGTIYCKKLRNISVPRHLRYAILGGSILGDHRWGTTLPQRKWGFFSPQTDTNALTFLHVSVIVVKTRLAQKNQKFFSYGFTSYLIADQTGKKLQNLIFFLQNLHMVLSEIMCEICYGFFSWDIWKT